VPAHPYLPGPVAGPPAGSLTWPLRHRSLFSILPCISPFTPFQPIAPLSDTLRKGLQLPGRRQLVLDEAPAGTHPNFLDQVLRLRSPSRSAQLSDRVLHLLATARPSQLFLFRLGVLSSWRSSQFIRHSQLQSRYYSRSSSVLILLNSITSNPPLVILNIHLLSCAVMLALLGNVMSAVVQDWQCATGASNR
jgi:hypothetical protein